MDIWRKTFQVEAIACAKTLSWECTGAFEKQQGGQGGCSPVIKEVGGRKWGQRGPRAQSMIGHEGLCKDVGFHSKWNGKALEDLSPVL